MAPSHLDAIVSQLEGRLNREGDLVEPPLIYLDPEAVRHLYQELTGLEEPPRIAVTLPEGGRPGRAEAVLARDSGYRPPARLLYESMVPVLAEQVPLVEGLEDLAPLAYRYARIRGRLQSTHFPDGHLNMEVLFAGARGMLFFTKAFFSSMVRPLLLTDRFHALHCEVEALVYVHGRAQRTIFYHQMFGDDLEHDWIPLVPVALRETESGEERE